MFNRLFAVLVIAGLPSFAGAQPKATAFRDKPSADDLKFFEAKIRPVLIEQCYSCHSEKTEKIKGGLLLDTRMGIRTGGDTGPIIIPGDPAKSLLIKALRYKDEMLQMPPKKKLPDNVIADFEEWVRIGAPDLREGGKVAVKQEIDIEKGREYWAFQKPVSKPLPPVKDADWPRSNVDRLILADLEAKSLKPVADADKRTLIRRVYLDLTGMPPPPEVVEQFAFNGDAAAFEKIVDQLLASPQFGERWARHWLDVARYAETSGKTVNFNYPNAWRYRDYVIDSFNKDKPYDRFIKEQLAGDLLPSSSDKQKAEQLIATGFLAIGSKSLNERNRLHFELDQADEQIDVTTQAFLGLTAACARCHDHKFDPIPQKDYYALVGIFRSTETCYGTIRFVQANHPSPLLPLPKGSVPSAITTTLTEKEKKDTEQTIADLRKKISTQEQIQKIFTSAQISLNQSKLDSYDADGNPKLQAMGVRDRFRTVDSPLYNRGEPEQPGKVVPRGVLQVVSKEMPTIRRGSSGRLELANWIASSNNPLTARVMVNRIWLHLFGKGIVPTADNFGAAGTAPTNPQLLDELAIDFMKNGWSIKILIRQLVLSRTYQLASSFDAKNFEIDPDNERLWRSSPRRLDAEAIRDSMLAISGKLIEQPPVGSSIAKAGEGPSNRPRLMTTRTDPNDPHRSVYLAIIRDNLPESLSLFDGADPSLVVAERATTTVPAQSLYLMNNTFVQRMSESAADRLIKKTSAESDRVREAYLLFFGRPPTEKEMASAEQFLSQYRKTVQKNRYAPARTERMTWAAFCQALFGSAEFLYRN